RPRESRTYGIREDIVDAPVGRFLFPEDSIEVSRLPQSSAHSLRVCMCKSLPQHLAEPRKMRVLARALYEQVEVIRHEAWRYVGADRAKARCYILSPTRPAIVAPSFSSA